MKFAESPQAVIRPHADRGFSLVELLILTGILATLAAVALIAVRGVADNGLETACAQDRRVVSIAIETYFADNHVDRLPGLPPADGNEFERGLVTAAVIRDVSAFYDVTADGSLVPESDSPCS